LGASILGELGFELLEHRTLNIFATQKDLLNVGIDLTFYIGVLPDIARKTEPWKQP